MKNLADLTVYDLYGQLALMIEVKNIFGTSPQWAARLHQNILAHGLLPQAKMFLLALPDHFYLWKEANALTDQNAPAYDINPAPFLQPYYEKIGLLPEQLSKESFKLIMIGWVNQLKFSDTVPPDLPPETQNVLAESGLFDVIKDGRIELDPDTRP